LFGLIIPDKDLKWNESKNRYDYGAINWDEFWQVVGGNGPCNKERVDARRKAKDDGKWVIEAALAFADKRNTKKSA
jgi:ring-1,2-phenylacetyl-CoA epoxidase subunit PaaA